MKSLQLNRPYAMMMVGIPGSGKSFFAEKFAATFAIPYIDSLVLEDHSRDEQAASKLIGFVLGELVKTDKSFIYEGNSDSRVRRTEFAAWARSKGYTPLFIWVQTDQHAALERTLRAKVMDKPTFIQTLKNYSPPHPSEKAVVISGRHTYASQAKVVLKRLGSDNRPAATSPQVQPQRPAQPAPMVRSVPVR